MLVLLKMLGIINLLTFGLMPPEESKFVLLSVMELIP